MSRKRLTQGINPGDLDQVIRDLGVRVRLFRSTPCPNMTSLESLDHNVNCTVCNNNMIDFDCKETVALFQQQDLQQPFKTQGTFHIDEIQATFLSGETLHIHTRVELLDFAEDFFELVQRQESTTVDHLKYPACSVQGLFVIRNDQQVRFHVGSDFEIDVNGDVNWINASHKPADREIYSIYYQHHPVFRSIKALHRDRYTQSNLRPNEIESPKVTVGDRTYVKLPETWILKRDYLLERRGQDGSRLDDNEFYDPNES